MKHIALLIALAAAFGVSAQEHWKFEVREKMDKIALKMELYTAPGKYRQQVAEGEGLHTTIVDSVMGRQLELFSDAKGKYAVTTALSAPKGPEVPDENDSTGSKNITYGDKEEYALDENEPLVIREGLDFQLLPEIKKLHGFQLRHVDLLQEGHSYGDGWLLIGQSLPGFSSYLLNNGTTGILVEFTMTEDGLTHIGTFTGYEKKPKLPADVFSLEPPMAYQDTDTGDPIRFAAPDVSNEKKE